MFSHRHQTQQQFETEALQALGAVSTEKTVQALHQVLREDGHPVKRTLLSNLFFLQISTDLHSLLGLIKPHQHVDDVKAGRRLVLLVDSTEKRTESLTIENTEEKFVSFLLLLTLLKGCLGTLSSHFLSALVVFLFLIAAVLTHTHHIPAER